MAGHKDVGGLDVSMDDSVPVSCLKAFGDFDGELDPLFWRHCLGRDHRFQGLALKQLHRDKMSALKRSHLVNRADVGVVQRRSCARFLLKSKQMSRVDFDVVREKLHRHVTPQRYIFSLVNYPHAAASDLMQNEVVID